MTGWTGEPEGTPPPRLSVGDESSIKNVLLEARRHGFLGPGPVESHIEQALGFAAVTAQVNGASQGSSGSDWTGRVLDLGTGGGIPGLVVAMALPRASLVLLDANQRRIEFVVTAVARLGLGNHVTVVRRRAEEAGRDSTFRSMFDRVLARSFAPPAVTAECAAPFLQVGGFLLVSEPPDHEADPEDRWPAAGLARLGMSPAELVLRGVRFVRIPQEKLCQTGFPRRVGIAAKRPLF